MNTWILNILYHNGLFLSIWHVVICTIIIFYQISVIIKEHTTANVIINLKLNSYNFAIYQCYQQSSNLPYHTVIFLHEISVNYNIRELFCGWLFAFKFASMDVRMQRDEARRKTFLFLFVDILKGFRDFIVNWIQSSEKKKKIKKILVPMDVTPKAVVVLFERGKRVCHK